MTNQILLKGPMYHMSCFTFISLSYDLLSQLFFISFLRCLKLLLPQVLRQTIEAGIFKMRPCEITNCWILSHRKLLLQFTHEHSTTTCQVRRTPQNPKAKCAPSVPTSLRQV